MDEKTVKHILAVLRRGTVTWAGRTNCLKRYRRKVFVRKGQNGQDIFKFEWPCRLCGRWFRDVKSVEVDHIVEVGSFTGCFDDYVRKMYCAEENLEPLCVVCHSKKSVASHSARSRYKRKST